MPLNDLEAAVLAKLLEGDHPLLTELRAQISHLHVQERTSTGGGFFTRFDALSLPELKVRTTVKFGDVIASILGLIHGAGFLSTLEGYSFGKPWPNKIDKFELNYLNADRKREFSKLNGSTNAGE